jgi:hypothetical protein
MSQQFIQWSSTEHILTVHEHFQFQLSQRILKDISLQNILTYPMFKITKVTITMPTEKSHLSGCIRRIILVACIKSFVRTDDH